CAREVGGLATGNNRFDVW
nr:immunoglobulin heavy chain junction region [Macaca mulatta]MOY23657.1 immunoglobulin heavy chain junction region [Macaca mulatta]MOY24325.1 immunoglobulin heavy chain junction region [Macaca mulatta]MOY25840.1 immunoglobulin heavy chain junction region [Macaca mulatta]MOY26255.1 immunoglobulin heavy chain junction region [Macaca mulatta]